MSCENCQCANCTQKRIDILEQKITVLSAEIHKKFKLDISCSYDEKDIEEIRNIAATTTTAEEFLQHLLTKVEIPFIQICYSNQIVSANVIGFLAMCSQHHKDNFFMMLTDDCNRSDEVENYFIIFEDFIKSYYNISDIMFNEFFNMIKTHTITFTENDFRIALI